MAYVSTWSVPKNLAMPHKLLDLHQTLSYATGYDNFPQTCLHSWNLGTNHNEPIAISPFSTNTYGDA